MLCPNTFQQKIADGKPTLGTHFLFADPDIPEIIGDTGLFDYAEFSAEYSSFDMPLLYHLARSGQCGNLPLMIKVDQESQGFWTQAAIGAGFRSVLFTDIREADDVDVCCQCVLPDTPEQHGRMGVKLRRPALSGYDTKEYLSELQSTVIAIMIEKNVTLENIDAVLERAHQRGVSLTQWGPADFGFSMGKPDLMHSDEIRRFEELVIRKSLEHGVQPRIEIGSVDQAKRYLDLGVQHFCIGWDRFLYQSAIKSLGEGMRGLLE
ncbi:MAG: aldolase/citrate lyase family protein [Planctomycetota bacterium]